MCSYTLYENCTCIQPTKPNRMQSIRIPDIIQKKKFGFELTQHEIDQFISGVVDGTVTGPQIGAFLMATYFKGMTNKETGHLLSAMVHSGKTMEWPSGWKGLVVDKHSTGGVGDKVSLVLAPALAALGLKVPMISGRGLGITGGTLDKLESIPGYNVHLNTDKIKDILEEVGCIIAGQTEDIVPADKKLYAIRDVTSTVDIMPMIVGSILSKKIAEKIDALVMEVTFGKCCFMETKEEARKLANLMIAQGNEQGLKISAMLVHMHHPLGMKIGNSLEVIEAIECLFGEGNKELQQTICKLGGQLLVDTNKAPNLTTGQTMIERSINDGTARAKFRKMLIAQEVSKEIADQLTSRDYSSLAVAKSITPLKAHKTGFIHGIDALACGQVVHQMGGGRNKEGDSINHAVGIELTAKIGDRLNEGEEWAKVHHDSDLTSQQLDILAGALEIRTGVPDIVDRVSEVIINTDN